MPVIFCWSNVGPSEMHCAPDQSSLQAVMAELRCAAWPLVAFSAAINVLKLTPHSTCCGATTARPKGR